MDVFVDGILYETDSQRYDHVKNVAAAYVSRFVGDNIIQDDIFSIIENYTESKEMPLEWIRLPIEDKELCACTFIRGGRIFVMLNTGIPLSKQIFAAAHELYHIRCYLEENDPELERMGSILDSRTIDSGSTREEEMEANAFAGLLLAPGDSLDQQIRIFRIERSEFTIDDILTLMNIFAIPYKAMVLRLMEEQIISKKEAGKLLSVPSEEISKRMKLTGKAKRWSVIPKGNESLGSIAENIMINAENEAVSESRLTSDMKKLDEIRKRYGIE